MKKCRCNYNNRNRSDDYIITIVIADVFILLMPTITGVKMEIRIIKSNSR